MKIISKIFALTLLAGLTSCDYFEIDNYPAPDSGIQGVVIDKKTGDSLQTEVGIGFKVNYYELSWQEAGHANTQSRYFWGKSDGTFQNTKVFAGKYIISLSEGAFFPVEADTVLLASGKLTALRFEVVPMGRVSITSITPKKNTADTTKYDLAIKYKVEDTENEVDKTTLKEDDYTLYESQVFISRKSPNVGVNNRMSDYDLNARKNIIADFPNSNNYKNYTETNIKGLSPGTWWIRAAVRTNNSIKRYNFSRVVQVTLP
ncbi:MAG TPA: DUF3823 domain-containing protein [Paludibacter sp.]|nr:DUF3823 domain-containing protein [Paludibacter sp.]